MQDLIERPQDEGCYVIDRRTQSVEESVNELTDQMFAFCNKTRRQRINQRNRVERLSPLLDWKNLGVEYSKARQLALRRAYPDSFYGADAVNVTEDEWEFGNTALGLGAERMGVPSVPASPRFRGGAATPGDMGTLTEEVRFRDFHLFHADVRLRCSLWLPTTTAVAITGQELPRMMTRMVTHCKLFEFEP